MTDEHISKGDVEMNPSITKDPEGGAPNDKAEYSLDLFIQGYSCSQSIVMAFADELGLEPETAARISSGFGFAAGKNREKTCGVVTGAIMAIGLKYGPGLQRDLYAKDLCALATQEFINRFAERRNGVACKKVHATFKRTERIRHLEAEPAFCAKVTRDAAEILEEILKEDY